MPSVAGRLPATLEAAGGGDGGPGARGWLDALLALDFATYLPGSILTKVDRASMAHGLEVRPPFLARDVVDWAFTLPSSLKLHRGTSKYLLKRAAAGHLPDDIIHRPKKGFAIPVGAWLRGPLKARLAQALSPSPLWDSGLLDRSVFQVFAAEHAARRGDHSKALWSLVVLDAWVRRELA
jgi:asparagine synthase (glutamine-hydrolysing)